METIDVPPNGKTESVEVVPPLVVQDPAGTTVTLPTKSIFASKTAIGVAVAGVCTVLQAFGLADINDALQGSIVDVIVAVANVAGLIYALYGRWVAKHKIV